MIIKVKRKKIEGNNYAHDFFIQRETSDEDIHDFHTFCISITRDLLNNRFRLNEYGSVSYHMDELSKEDIELTDMNLKYLSDVIIKEKTDLDNSLNDMLE